ncbi:hypothetical protein MNB_SV-15-964 [hydrothermal vent metagenome]|uniref:Uncharacterized protein n=1 Tax=hydrothermal vent metagenome TaxID=652676 RepID=A0A1W1EKM4_9ZZZZ
MPTRKIVLPDMYELYKDYLYNKSKIQLSFATNISNDITLHFEMKMDAVLKSYINIVYGRYIKGLRDIDILNYLKDKFFREFYEDIMAFMNGVSYNDDDNDNIYNIKNIKNRLIPMQLDHFDTKYDSTVWFWNEYLTTLKNR